MSNSLQELAEKGFAALDAGRFEESVAAFEALLAINPDLPDYWYNLGFAQRRARHFEEALASYQQALDRGVREPEQVHLNRAVVLATHLNRPKDAEAELEAALALSPRYFPALLNLGGLHEDSGNKAAAKSAYERALEVDPGDTLVLTSLAVLADITDAGDPLVARLEQRLDDARTAADERADLGFALGKILDGTSEYDRAFKAYGDANRASRASWDDEQTPYDPSAEAQMTDRIIEAFSTPNSSRSADEEERPIFICGMFRSGSTLTERILARHSRVDAGGELDLVPMLLPRVEPYPESAARAEKSIIAEMRQSYLGELDIRFPGANFVTDKRPANFRYIGLLKQMFPGARIIDTLRDPIDNCLSIWFAHLGPSAPYAVELDHIVHWYREYRRLMSHWTKIWPDDIYTLEYDSLVEDPEPEIRALLDFCGLDFEEGCLEPHKAEGTIRTLSAWQVREPVYRSSSGRWHNYESHIGTLLAAFDQN